MVLIITKQNFFFIKPMFWLRKSRGKLNRPPPPVALKQQCPLFAPCQGPRPFAGCGKLGANRPPSRWDSAFFFEPASFGNSIHVRLIAAFASKGDRDPSVDGPRAARDFLKG